MNPYKHFLTDKSIYFSWQTALLFVLFFVFRGLSFALDSHSVIQGILVFVLLMVFGICYYKDPKYAWYILLTELFLGGAGHFLSFGGLSIRSILVMTFLILWIIHQIGKRHLLQKMHIDKQLLYILIAFGVTVWFAAINGIANNHDLSLVIADAVPFSYFLLLFPAYELFKDKDLQAHIIRLLIVFIFGTTIFSLFTEFLFSSGIVVLQEPFYKWFRDVNLGKITDMGTGFFRIVDPTHVFLPPFILLISSLLMRDEKHHLMWRVLLGAALLALAINFSRGYFLALGVGFIILTYKHSLVKWISVSGFAATLFLTSFITVHFFASNFQSAGLELLGLRIGSMAAPAVETSAATRMMILPEALAMIGAHPILGSGLGSTVTFTNTITYEVLSTPQFDWGYIELYVELGLFGTIAYAVLLIYIAMQLLFKITRAADYHDFYVGLLAGLISLLVMNITAPILFHVIGILTIVLITLIAIQPVNIFQSLISTIYRVFHKK